MKNYTVALCIFSFFICLNGFPQSRDSLLKVYNNQTIYRYGNKYIKGNEKLSYQDLSAQFNTPATREMYKKSKNKLVVGRVFNIASVAVIIVSVFTKTNVGGSIAFAAGTGVLGLTGIYYQTESSKYLERALWERNRDIITGADSGPR